MKLIVFLTSLSLLFVLPPPAYGQKPLLSLDDFFNSVDIRAIQISPDGHDVIIETVRADWPSNSFRNDLWLYHDMDGGSLVLITQSSHDGGAQWSPDGHSIAFLSDRKVTNAEPKVPDHGEKEDIENAVAQVYVVSARGGEAFPVSFSDEGVHTFAWSADSHRIYFATRNRWTEKQKDEHRKEWSDVVQFRESERGDTVFGIEVAFAAPHSIASASRLARPEPATIAAIPYRVDQMAASPDGHRLAFTTSSRSGRIESSVPYGIYVIDLPNGGAPRLVLHTPGPPDSPGLPLATLGLSTAARSFFRTVLAHPKVLLNLLRTVFTRCPCRKGNPFDGHQRSAAIWKATRWRPVAVLSGPRAVAIDDDRTPDYIADPTEYFGQDEIDEEVEKLLSQSPMGGEEAIQ